MLETGKQDCLSYLAESPDNLLNPYLLLKKEQPQPYLFRICFINRIESLREWPSDTPVFISLISSARVFPGPFCQPIISR